MMASSDIRPGEFIIHDTSPESFHAEPAGQSRGLDLSDRVVGGYAYGGTAEPFPDSLLIPRSEWPDRIKEMEERKSRLSDLIIQASLPSKNQQQTNYCFPSGTLIRMADGTYTPIEQVRVLDKVLTAEGNIRRVVKTAVHDVNEPIINLKMWGHSHLRATSEHPILTKRGYVPIGQLRIGDKVAFPKYAPQATKFIVTGDYLYEKNYAPQAKKKYRTYNHAPAGGSSFSLGIPGRASVTKTKHPVPDILELTPDFGRLAGFYLAEGCTSPWTVHFSFNAKEKDTLAAECADLIRRTLGCEPHVRVRMTVCHVSIHGANWSKLFDALFSRGSGGKRLCADLASGPMDFLCKAHSGWRDGDRKVKNGAVTVSKQLALNMFDITNMLGLRPILTTHQNEKVGRDGIKRKKSWLVDHSENINHGTEQDDKCLWRSVRGLEQEDYCGPVFNIEVEGDNSYVAEGIGVHNCWINAPTHCIEIDRVEQNQEMVILSPASAGGPIKNFRNQGGWGKEGLEWIGEHGLVPVDKWPANAIDRRYYTEENKALALKYRNTEWWEIDPTNLDQLISCLLRRKPVAVGLNWWGHEVTYIDPVWVDGAIAIRFRNSWGMDWPNAGAMGFSILQGKKMIPDDAVSPRVVLAS